MKKTLSTILLITTIYGFAAPVTGQPAGCNTGRCYPPSEHAASPSVQPEHAAQASVQPQTSKFVWQKHANDPGRWYLYADGQLVGGFDIAGQYYRPYLSATDSWGLISPSPEPEQTSSVFGVDTSKLSGKDAYTVYSDDGCKRISKHEAHRMVGQKLEDDSSKLRITIIGDDGRQKQVSADLQSLMKDIDSWAMLRGYPPGHWALEPGFVQSGSPTIYCQAPSGQVLHRQDDYEGGPSPTVEALRKAKTNYDARKDPDLRKTPEQPTSKKYVSYALAAVAGAGVMHLTKRRK